jgi:hypothetical protein
LYEKLAAQCSKLGRLEMVHEASAEGLGAVTEPPPPISTETFRNAWQLEPEGQAVLKFLIDWYNGLDAEAKEAAPDTKGLFSLASRRPKTLEELGGLRAVPRRAASIFGRQLVAGIKRASEGAAGSEFTAIEPPPYAHGGRLARRRLAGGGAGRGLYGAQRGPGAGLARKMAEEAARRSRGGWKRSRGRSAPCRAFGRSSCANRLEKSYGAIQRCPP